MKFQVLAVDAKGRTVGDCGHHHASKTRAVRCLWTPSPWPDRVDLIVVDVDAPRRRP